MDSERYNRQLILQGFGEQAQKKLATAKVLVVGAGGLGCPALQYLAAAGVGRLGIVDDDIISLSNLNRQILYTTGDLGKLKVTVVKARLTEMNAEVHIVSYSKRLVRDNIVELLGEYDVVFDGTDNFKTRYLINDVCAVLKRPLIFAAVSGYEGQLAVFNVPDENGLATNYRDLFPVEPAVGEIPNCAENGVLGVLPGIIGMMAAGEIIKLITGIGKPLINRLLHYILLNNEQYELKITTGEYYQLPNSVDALLSADIGHRGYIEIDGEQLDSIRKEKSSLCIDVREEHEFPRLDKNIYQQFPMSNFNALLEEEINEKNIVLICQHGIRSVAAAEAMHEKYGNTKNIYSLKGGIAKWHNYLI